MDPHGNSHLFNSIKQKRFTTSAFIQKRATLKKLTYFFGVGLDLLASAAFNNGGVGSTTAQEVDTVIYVIFLIDKYKKFVTSTIHIYKNY